MKSKNLLSLAIILALILSCFPTMAFAVAEETSNNPRFDSSKWLYNAEDDVYYQLQVPYGNPVEGFGSNNMKIAVYVPGAYINATANGDGTFTVTDYTNAVINGYTAETAPIMLPVETGGWKPQDPDSEYQGSKAAVKDYLDAGIVYIQIGCRGRDTEEANGRLPWAVAEMKAGIRYLRVNNSVIPGNKDRMFTQGHSAGGAQSGMIGATGDAPEYLPYLYKLGAAGVTYDEATGQYSSSVSDAVCGTQQYCPQGSGGIGSEAYEWQIGQYLSEDTSSTTGVVLDPSGERMPGSFHEALSRVLAADFAEYVNNSQFKHPVTGEVLTLTDEAPEIGIYASGSYYDLVKELIEKSLNDYIDLMTDEDGTFHAGYNWASGNNSPFKEEDVVSTVDEFIASMCERTGRTWIYFDEASGSYKITSVGEFAANVKTGKSTKKMGSTDNLGTGSQNFAIARVPNSQGVEGRMHISQNIYNALKDNLEYYRTFADWDDTYFPDNYESDFYAEDEVGNTTLERVHLAEQLTYTLASRDGYGTAHPAKYWRINTGIFEIDSANPIAINMYLALKEMENNGEIESAQLNLMWNQRHTQAELDGFSTNYRQFIIAWIAECCKNEDATSYYVDVSATAYYADAVAWAVEQGVTNGTSSTTFSPNNTVTRGQAVTFLWRAMGRPEPTSTVNPFSDVSESSYYYKAILWAAEKGITTGVTTTTFEPAGTCTRDHIITFLWRTMGSPDKTGSGAWYDDAANWAVSKSLLEGTADAFAHGVACPRADVVLYLYRAIAV